MKYLLVSLSLCLLVCASKVQAATYWVSPTGNNASCATIAASGPTTTVAKTTIDAALTCMAAGDTLNIRAGTYGGSIRQTGWPSGTLGAYTTIQAYNNEAVTITAGLALYNDINSHHILIKGVTINNTTGFAVYLSHHITFEDVVVTGINNNNQVSTSPGTIFRRVTFRDGVSDCVPGNRWYGLYISASADIIVENSTFFNLPGGGIQAYNGGSTANTNLTIRNNTFHDVPTCGTSNIGGFLISDTTSGQAYNNVIYNTLITNTGNKAPGMYLFSGSSNFNLYGNTVYNAGYGILIEGSVSGTIGVKNNILSTNTLGPYSNTSSATIVADHNLCSTTCGFGSTNQAESAATTFTTPGSNFTLKAGSAAIGTGATLGSPYDSDILATARPQGTPALYDIGAYESISSAPVPVVTITGPTSASTLNTAGISTVTLSGTSSISGGSVAWTCDRCTVTSGSATGTSSWTLPTLTLKSGVNIITVTHTTAAGGVGTDTITVTYAPTFPGNALVAAYAFESISGNNVTDSTSYANTALLVNGATQVDAKFGKGVRFNPASLQYISAIDANQIDFTQSFTFSLWVKPAHVPTGFRAAIIKNYMIALYASQDGTYCTSGGPVIWFNTNGNSGPSYSACYSTPLTVGQWSHLAGTYDGANLKLYINGVLVTTTSAGGYIEPSTATAMIGNSQFNEYFDGDVDEVRMYNYAIPRLGALNTTPNVSCQNASEESSSPVITPVEGWSGPSIVGSMNCPIVPLAAPIAFKIGAASSFKLGASSSMEIGGVP